MSDNDVKSALDQVDDAMDRTLDDYDYDARAEEVGTVTSVEREVAWASGLGGVKYEEVVSIEGGIQAMVLDVRRDRVGLALLDHPGKLASGNEIKRSGEIFEVPVGEEIIGRIIDPLGRALDEKEAPRASGSREALREAPPIMHRAPVDTPLQTGLKAVDALIPIGRGQRELILGDRQTGKTAIAVDAILNQKDSEVLCIYCAIGQRSSATAKVIEKLRRNNALDYTAVVAAEGDDPAGLRYVAPYAATAMAEHLMENGRDVLVVFDDLTRHARAYRELSLLFRRPPGREAYPGDIFYIHSRLLERSTRLRKQYGGGSLTALPIIETQAENISAYIPTNLISITDGQVYLSPGLFRKGVLPAIDIGKSVSRVGGKAQLPSYRKVAGDLRLSYSQFEELESFSRFGTRLDEKTRRQLEHGRRVREVLKQNESSPLSVPEQLAVLYAVSNNMMDEVPVEKMEEAQQAVVEAIGGRDQFSSRLAEAGKDDGDVWEELTRLLDDALKPFVQKSPDNDAQGEST